MTPAPGIVSDCVRDGLIEIARNRDCPRLNSIAEMKDDGSAGGAAASFF
jgi:hypothetical protein